MFINPVVINIFVMGDTYSQIYFHFVFAVKFRQMLIPAQHKEEIHKFITSLVQTRGHKMIAVHCMPDHLHMLIGFNPDSGISQFVREIKVASNKFINEKRWSATKFNWQEGYGVFSYSRSAIATVARYIENQEAHHRQETFKDEYKEILDKFGVPFQEKYLFDFRD